MRDDHRFLPVVVKGGGAMKFRYPFTVIEVQPEAAFDIGKIVCHRKGCGGHDHRFQCS